MFPEANLYKDAVSKLNHLNQTVEGFNFKVIPTLQDLSDEAHLMENSVFNYYGKIIDGNYVILTIDNINGDSVNETHSNIGFDIFENKLIFEQAKAKANYRCRESVISAIKKYCEINNIPWEDSYCAFDLDVNKQYEYR